MQMSCQKGVLSSEFLKQTSTSLFIFVQHSNAEKLSDPFSSLEMKPKE